MKTIKIKSPFWLGDTVFLTERSKLDQTKFLVRKAIVKELKFSQKENDILEYRVKFCDNHETKSCCMDELLNNENLARDAVDMVNSSLKDYEDLIRLGVIQGPIIGVVNSCERNDKYKWHEVRVPDNDGDLHIKLGTMKEIISWTENDLSNVVISGKIGLKQYENNQN